MNNRRRARRARARVRVDKGDVRPFMFLMVLTAWMLLWTFDAALSAPGDEATTAPGPLAAVGSVTVDGSTACIGVLTAPRQVLTAAHCLWDAEAGRWLLAHSVRFVAGLKDTGFRSDAAILSYRVSPRFDPAQAQASAGAEHDWVLLELDDGLGGAVAPLPEMSVVPVRSIRIWDGHPKFQPL